VISAGLSPKKQGFFFEDLKAPFALMIIASRENNRSDASVRAFVKAYQSEPVRTFIIKTFKGAVNPAW
jgi:D-methionine transport system substrate-binding protein